MDSGEPASVACNTDYTEAAFAALAIFRRYYAYAVYVHVLNRFSTPSKSNCTAAVQEVNNRSRAKLDRCNKKKKKEKTEATRNERAAFFIHS